MSDVAKCLGDEYTIRHKGKDYALVPWDRYGIQKKFRAWMIQQAVQALRDMRPFQTPDEAAAAQSQLNKDVSSGVYDWGGDVWAKHLSSEAGIVQIVYLDLRANHPEATPALATEILQEHAEEAKLMMEWLVTDPTKAAESPATTS